MSAVLVAAVINSGSGAVNVSVWFWLVEWLTWVWIIACTLSVSSCRAWKSWLMTGSFDGDVHNVSTWLVIFAKIAVDLRELSFVFWRNVVDR